MSSEKNTNLEQVVRALEAELGQVRLRGRWFVMLALIGAGTGAASLVMHDRAQSAFETGTVVADSIQIREEAGGMSGSLDSTSWSLSHKSGRSIHLSANQYTAEVRLSDQGGGHLTVQVSDHGGEVRAMPHGSIASLEAAGRGKE